MKVKSMVNIFIYGLKNGEIYEVIDEDELFYIIETEKGRQLFQKDWFEFISEETISKTETVEKYKSCTKEKCKNYQYKNGINEMYCKECFNDKENYINFKPVEKDIELPNEFYFKHIEVKNVLFNAKLIDGEYTISNDKNDNKTFLSSEYIKNFIEYGFWVIIELPINKEKELQEKFNKMVNDLDNAVYDKYSKFIKLTTIEDFKVTIAKDKIVSVLQYEDKCFITTVSIEGTFTVKEYAEDIIRMLEE